jgi:hypothetical protein
MAEPLARSDAIRLLENAVGLLRQVPAGVLVTHWIGSVPFALALLFTWSSVTNTRTTDAAWASESLVLALLLLWMNCCRAVYAGKLRRHLSGASDLPWTARRAFRLGAIQSFSGATKLLVLPFSLLIIFPWAKVVAFYRTMAVVADREELTPRQAMAQARRLAGFKPAQNWLVLALLFLLQAVVTLNLAIVLGLLPQIVRILTGYESTYSRSGVYFAFNPMFVLLVLAVSWLAFDPFVQAVYCLRSFEAESMATGEDLRCGLRRIRMSAQVVGALLLLIVVAPHARAQVSPADLEKSVEQAVQAPEYDWRFPPAPAAANTPWIVKVVDRLVTVVRRATDAAGGVIKRFLKWLGDQLFPKGAGQPKGAPPGAGLDWTVAALIALVVCAGALFAWQRQRLRRARLPVATPESAALARLDAPDLNPDALSEDRWLELAERCLAEQNFRFALRAWYLGSLAWLGRREVLSIHPGKTNRDYQNELNRRARAFPAARGLFAGNVTAFERAWYGLYAVSAEEAARFRERTDQLKSTLTRPEGVTP